MCLSNNYIAFLTIVRYQIRRLVRIWVQTVLPSIITMSLYFLIFGHLIGQRIGAMEGINYINFIVPGLIMMSIVTNAYANTVSTFFGAKFVRSLEELMVAPVASTTIVLGYLAGGVVRGMLIGLVVLLVAISFTEVSIHNASICIIMAFLASVLFSLLGLINGVFSKKFDDVTIIPTFVLTPLTYLGGVFYSVNLLPDFGKALSFANPMLYIINAFRFGFLGISDINVTAAVVMTLLFSVLMFFIAWYLLEKGIGLKS